MAPMHHFLAHHYPQTVLSVTRLSEFSLLVYVICRQEDISSLAAWIGVSVMQAGDSWAMEIGDSSARGVNGSILAWTLEAKVVLVHIPI